MGAAGSPLKGWRDAFAAVGDGRVRCQKIGHAGRRNPHPIVGGRLRAGRRFEPLHPSGFAQRPVESGERQPHAQGELEVHRIVNGEAVGVRELEGLSPDPRWGDGVNFDGQRFEVGVELHPLIGVDSSPASRKEEHVGDFDGPEGRGEGPPFDE